MAFFNSRQIHPNAYPRDMCGLSVWLPVRVHENPSIADRGALRAQRDWERTFGLLPPGFCGTMCTDFNFVAITMPETLPDRLELVAYLVEMMFLIHDRIDTATEESLKVLAAPYVNDCLRVVDAVKMIDANGGELDLDYDDASWPPVTRLVVSVAREMFAVDRAAARTALVWLEKWMRDMREGPKAGEPMNLDEYLTRRLADVTFL
jgi:hypothetical protein